MDEVDNGTDTSSVLYAIEKCGITIAIAVYCFAGL
jgi:hypothetical protein